MNKEGNVNENQTKAPKFFTKNQIKPHWEPGHYHTKSAEILEIKNGEVLVATSWKGKKEIVKLKPGKEFRIEPGVPHRIYVMPKAFFIIRHSDEQDLDFHISSELDEFCNSHKV